MNNRIVVRTLLALVSVSMACAMVQAQPAAAPAKQPAVKSAAEGQALQAIFHSADNQARIKLATDFLVKFADSDFKALVLMVTAETYRQLNDYANMIIYAERTLETDPNHYMAMLMLASGIGQRTREFDLDREEKLGRVEKYANRAMEILKTAPSPTRR